MKPEKENAVTKKHIFSQLRIGAPKKYVKTVLQLILFFSVTPLFSNLDKENYLVEHVLKSIESANNHQSRLTPEILSLTGMSSAPIRHFLNNLCNLPNATYLEIGCWQGSTLISAAYKNEDVLKDIVAIDNWSEFGGPKTTFLANIEQYLHKNSVRHFEHDCFTLPLNSVIRNKVNIYFFDGDHSKQSQKKALTYYDPVLADVFILCVDDWNYPPAKEGTFEAMRELNYQVIYEKEIFTPILGDVASWWNGFYIAVLKKQPR